MSSFARTITGDLDFSTHTLVVVTDVNQCAAWDLEDRLALAQGEWIYDTTQGVPYFSFMGVKNPSIPAIQEMFRQACMSVQGIVSASVKATLNRPTRALSVTVACTTNEGYLITGGPGTPFVITPPGGSTP